MSQTENFMRILILNGPNLGLLGKREPEKYGTTSLKDIQSRLKKKFARVKFTFVQSNIEGEMVDRLNQALRRKYDGVVINPGAYGHYSYAIRDAVAALTVPVIEVHLTNVHAREEFRRHSVIAPVCNGVVAGLGPISYELAVRFLLEKK
jgi:3-dehydroquinate dehydratase-2